MRRNIDLRHGHVLQNDNGSKARCGGPGICVVCSMEASQVKPDGHVHTMPLDKTHYESSYCWCYPMLADDFTGTGGKKHFLHREIQ